MNKEEKKWKPMNDWVLIHLDSPEVVTPSGLIVVNDNPIENPPTSGTVIRAGKKCTQVKPGDRIQFVKYAVIESDIYEDGKKIDLLHERDIELIIYDE